jgi:hypothetical protein
MTFTLSKGEIGQSVDEDLCSDLVVDTIDLIDETAVVCPLYPAAPMVSSSIINLMSQDELSKNVFIQLLMQVTLCYSA